MRVRKLGTLAALAAAGAFVACTLNPQPLPPNDDQSTFSPGDASASVDGGSLNSDPETPATGADAGAPPPRGEGGTDGSDGGDAGSDGGDGGISDASDAG